MKRFLSLMMTLAMVLGVSSVCLAANTVTINTGVNNAFGGIGGNVLGLVRWFGMALGIGMLLYIGIKYMMASANEKADLKKGSISYVIGAIIVIGASSLFGLFETLTTDVMGS